MDLGELKAKLVDAQSVHETSHHAGQALAALGPMEEWLAHLARHGYHYVLVAKEEWDKLCGAEAAKAPVLLGEAKSTTKRSL